MDLNLVHLSGQLFFDISSRDLSTGLIGVNVGNKKRTTKPKAESENLKLFETSATVSINYLTPQHSGPSFCSERELRV